MFIFARARISLTHRCDSRDLPHDENIIIWRLAGLQMPVESSPNIMWGKPLGQITQSDRTSPGTQICVPYLTLGEPS